MVKTIKCMAHPLHHRASSNRLNPLDVECVVHILYLESSFYVFTIYLINKDRNVAPAIKRTTLFKLTVSNGTNWKNQLQYFNWIIKIKTRCWLWAVSTKIHLTIPPYIDWNGRLNGRIKTGEKNTKLIELLNKPKSIKKTQQKHTTFTNTNTNNNNNGNT